jgi:hypothetical protein
MRTFQALMILACVGGCATYRDDLNRGRQAYEQNHYVEALSTWRALQWDLDALEPAEQVRYAYLRGMTDYRLGLRSDARHWLAFADALDRQNPDGLTEDWRRRLNEAMADLNAQVWQVTPAEAMALDEARDNGAWPGAADSASRQKKATSTSVQQAILGSDGGGALQGKPAEAVP